MPDLPTHSCHFNANYRKSWYESGPSVTISLNESNTKNNGTNTFCQFCSHKLCKWVNKTKSK